MSQEDIDSFMSQMAADNARNAALDAAVDAEIRSGGGNLFGAPSSFVQSNGRGTLSGTGTSTAPGASSSSIFGPAVTTPNLFPNAGSASPALQSRGVEPTRGKTVRRGLQFDASKRTREATRQEQLEELVRNARNNLTNPAPTTSNPSPADPRNTTVTPTPAGPARGFSTFPVNPPIPANAQTRPTQGIASSGPPLKRNLLGAAPTRNPRGPAPTSNPSGPDPAWNPPELPPTSGLSGRPPFLNLAGPTPARGLPGSTSVTYLTPMSGRTGNVRRPVTDSPVFATRQRGVRGSNVLMRGGIVPPYAARATGGNRNNDAGATRDGRPVSGLRRGGQAGRPGRGQGEAGDELPEGDEHEYWGGNNSPALRPRPGPTPEQRAARLGLLTTAYDPNDPPPDDATTAEGLALGVVPDAGGRRWREQVMRVGRWANGTGQVVDGVEELTARERDQLDLDFRGHGVLRRVPVKGGRGRGRGRDGADFYFAWRSRVYPQDIKKRRQSRRPAEAPVDAPVPQTSKQVVPRPGFGRPGGGRGAARRGVRRVEEEGGRGGRRDANNNNNENDRGGEKSQEGGQKGPTPLSRAAQRGEFCQTRPPSQPAHPAQFPHAHEKRMRDRVR